MARTSALFAILLFISVCIYGQTDSTKNLFDRSETDTLRIFIEAIDNTEYTGILLSEDDRIVELETDLGVIIKIPKIKILRYKTLQVKEIVDGEYYFENPHATRYFYGPNGYGLRQGEGYYQNTWVMFNQVSYGFSDYFSVGTGIIPLFLFEGAPTPAWLTPKFSIPIRKDKINVGGGALLATVIGETDASFGIAYGTITLGSRDANTTLGAGWAYTGDGFGEYPTFSLSGMYRLGPKGYFISENYLISTAYETIGIISLGGRTVQKKLAVDYGLILPLNIGATIAFPWLSITLPFGAWEE
jgi:hypothetical protein